MNSIHWKAVLSAGADARGACVPNALESDQVARHIDDRDADRKISVMRRLLRGIEYDPRTAITERAQAYGEPIQHESVFLASVTAPVRRGPTDGGSGSLEVE